MSATVIESPEHTRPEHGRKINPWLVLVIACLAQFMVVLDATVVNIALPSVQRGLHFSAANLQWVVNAYTLIFGGFLLLGGRAADLLGRKRLFVAGVILFSAASLLNGVAQSSGMLIVGRGLQGLGGALVSPAALSIVTTTFSDGEQRTKALGVWSAIAAGGAAAGLLLGGILTQIASWRWVFFVNVPVGIATVALAVRYVSRVPGRRRASLLRRGRGLHGDQRTGRPRLRHRQGPGLRLGLDPHPGSRRGGLCPARRLPGHREPQQGATHAAEHLPDPDPVGGRHHAAPGRLGHVRHVLLRLALRPGDPRLQPDPGRTGLPPGERWASSSGPASPSN